MNQNGKYSTTLTPKNTSGWHLQPISLLVNAANKFESEIVVKFGQRMASAKSHLGILALGAGKGARLYVSARGHDAQKAIKAIKDKFSADPDNSSKKIETSKGLVSTTFKCGIKPEAKKVFLVGDFNGWDPQAEAMTRHGSQFSKCIRLPPGRYQYKFVIDGKWHADPNAPVVMSELGSTNNVVNV